MSKTSRLTALLLLAAACNNPAADAPAASIGDPASPEPRTAEAPSPAADKGSTGKDARPATGSPLAFNGSNSSIVMVGSKVTGSHDLKIVEFVGEVSAAAGAPLESGSVRVTMQMASVEADHPKLTAHLKDGDFFLISEHPTSSFESTAIKAGGAGGATHTVTGNLTLRGVTKTIGFPANITRNDKGVSVTAKFAIDRQDFKIVYPGKPDDLIRDEVLIKLDLNAR